MNRALFLDRDGVINEDYGYVHKIEDFHFREGIFEVCRAAQTASMKIVVVTNQAGIGRGLYSLDDFEILTNYMYNCLADRGIWIDRLFYCPYHPLHGIGHFRKYSYDRKPSPGLLVRACNELDINPFFSILIGDSKSDHEAARRLGMKYIIDSTDLGWVDLSLRSIALLS